MTEVKTLRSQLDEIASVLDAIPAPVHNITAVTAFQQQPQPAHTALPDPNAHSNCSDGIDDTAVSSKAVSVLDWSALPAAVDPGSTAMGVSTRRKAAYKPDKQKPVDQEKIQARADRKRAQVESFLLVLQPVLQAAGHNLAPPPPPPPPPAAAIQASSGAQQSCSSCTHDLQHVVPSGHQHQQQQQQQQQWAAPCHQPRPAPEQQQQQQQMQQAAQREALQPPAPPPISLHIVDFGCGSGNLLLPLAALLPGCRSTGVDMKPAALGLLMQRAAAAGLSNVSVFTGMIEQYREPFDVALALHACGNATDRVLQMAVDQRAAFVVSPCCVGKLRFSLTGGSSFHSEPITWTPTQPGDQPVHDSSSKPTAQPPPQPPASQPQEAQHIELDRQQADGQQQHGGVVPRLRHPRSDWLMSHLPDPERHFRIMAKVADVSHAPSDRAELAEALQQRMGAADMCKRFVELDRCAAAAESGYAVGLFKVLQADSMAKNDLLVGLPLPPAAHCKQHTPTAAAAAGAAGCRGKCGDATSPPAPSATAAATDDVNGCSWCSGSGSSTSELGADAAADSSGDRVLQQDVLSCFCHCGEALHARGVLFTREKLCSVHTTDV